MVTLSVIESEYIAVSEVCSEILYMCELLEFLGIYYACPITVNVDNMRAILLSNISNVIGRKKHIDVFHHF